MHVFQQGESAQLLLKLYDKDTVREWLYDKIESNIKQLMATKIQASKAATNRLSPLITSSIDGCGSFDV